MIRYLFFAFICLANISLAQLGINEVSSSNNSLIKDEFGSSSDWIELYNSSDSIIDLKGYFLSDDIRNPYKFQIEEAVVESNDHLLIFASGNNISKVDKEVLSFGAVFGSTSGAYADDENEGQKGNSTVRFLDSLNSFVSVVNGDTSVSAVINLRDNTSGLGYSYGGLTIGLSEDNKPLNLASYTVLALKATITENALIGVRFVQEGLEAWKGYTFPLMGNGIKDFVYSIPLYKEAQGLDKTKIISIELVPNEVPSITEMSVSNITFLRSSNVGCITRFNYSYTSDTSTYVVPYENDEIVGLSDGRLMISAKMYMDPKSLEGPWAGIGVTLGQWNEVADYSEFSKFVIEGYLDKNKKVTIRFVENSKQSYEAYGVSIVGTGLINDRYEIILDPELINLKDIKSIQIEGNMMEEVKFTFTDWYFYKDLQKESIGSLHTNFKLSSAGDLILLYDNKGAFVDKMDIPFLKEDISFGREGDGGSNYAYFKKPTPNAPNSELGFAGFCVEPIQFNYTAGFYKDPIQLVLSGANEIRYTIDGSEPTPYSNLFTAAISLDSVTVVRAACFDEGKIPEQIFTNTYFVGYDSQLPVWSISTHPGNFFDSDTGIYVFGPEDYEDKTPYFDANFWEDWERPVTIEFFEQTGEKVFTEDCGVKVFGNYSRANPKKSLNFSFRKKYGKTKLDYRLFPDYPGLSSFDDFLLRASGNDFDHLLFRDGFNQALMSDADIDIQKMRASVLFINGEYWGIHNIREKSNTDYMKENHNLDQDEVDLISHYFDFRTNSGYDFEDFSDDVGANKLTYKQISDYVDIESFIQYQAFEIYIANYDWPANNVKYWRKKESGSKWRWFAYDTDFSTMIYGDSNTHYTVDMFKQAYTYDPNIYWPNSEKSTCLLREFMKFPEFKTLFVTRYSDMMNSRFHSSHVLPLVDSFVVRIEKEIPKNHERWFLSVNDWEAKVDSFKVFWEKRGEYARANMKSHLNLGNEVKIDISFEPEGAGFVKFNSLYISKDWSGIYFDDFALSLSAFANSGYEVDHIEIDGQNQLLSEVKFSPKENQNVHVVFKHIEGEGRIVISEFNYHDGIEKQSGDWVELHNMGDANVDISGWLIKDEKLFNGYVFAEGTVLKPDEYLVLVEDDSAFTSVFPFVNNKLIDLGFSLDNSGEHLYLLDKKADEVIHFKYNDKNGWPLEADGRGYTLNLVNPDIDQDLPEAWDIACLGGSPGSEVNYDCLSGIVQEGAVNTVDISVYPNPVYNQLSIRFGYPSIDLIRVKSLDGRILLEDYVDDKLTYEVQVDSFIRGMYLLEFVNSNEVITKSFIKI